MQRAEFFRKVDTSKRWYLSIKIQGITSENTVTLSFEITEKNYEELKLLSVIILPSFLYMYHIFLFIVRKSDFRRFRVVAKRAYYFAMSVYAHLSERFPLDGFP